MSDFYRRWAQSSATYSQGRSQCFKKSAYPTESKAQRYAKKRTIEEGREIYTYHCSICKQWHLTKKPGDVGVWP